MPRFTIKDLLMSTAMVGVGLACALLAARLARTNKIPTDANSPQAFYALWIYVLWLFGCVTTGIGFFYPFKLVGVGATTGMLASIVLMLLALVSAF